MALCIKMTTTKEMLEEKGYKEGIIVSDTNVMMNVRNNYRPTMGKFTIAHPWEIAKGNAIPYANSYGLPMMPYADGMYACMQLAGMPTMGARLRNTVRDIRKTGFSISHPDKDITKFMWEDDGECINFLRIGKGDVLIHGKAELDGAEYKIITIKEIMASNKEDKYTYYILDPSENNALSDGTDDEEDDIFGNAEYGDGTYRTYAIIYNGKYFGAVRTSEDGSLKMWYRPVNKKNDGELFAFDSITNCSLFALPYLLFNTIDGGEMEGFESFKQNIPITNREVVICSGEFGCRVFNMPPIIREITAKKTAEFTGETDYILAAFKHYAAIDKFNTEGEYSGVPVLKEGREREYYLNAMYESKIEEMTGIDMWNNDIMGVAHYSKSKAVTQSKSFSLYTNVPCGTEWTDEAFAEKATVNVHIPSFGNMYGELLEVSHKDRENILNILDTDNTVNFVVCSRNTLPGYMMVYRLKDKDVIDAIRSRLVCPLTGSKANYSEIFKLCEEVNLEEDCDLILKVSILE